MVILFLALVMFNKSIANVNCKLSRLRTHFRPLLLGRPRPDPFIDLSSSYVHLKIAFVHFRVVECSSFIGSKSRLDDCGPVCAVCWVLDVSLSTEKTLRCSLKCNLHTFFEDMAIHSPLFLSRISRNIFCLFENMFQNNEYFLFNSILTF